jgi:hypothetical protein
VQTDCDAQALRFLQACCPDVDSINGYLTHSTGLDFNHCGTQIIAGIRVSDSQRSYASWRKRVGVEPTILAAKDRIHGFEGHEGHRTPFASDHCKCGRLRALLDIRNFPRQRLRLWRHSGAIGFDACHQQSLRV